MNNKISDYNKMNSSGSSIGQFNETDEDRLERADAYVFRQRFERGEIICCDNMAHRSMRKVFIDNMIKNDLYPTRVCQLVSYVNLLCGIIAIGVQIAAFKLQAPLYYTCSGFFGVVHLAISFISFLSGNQSKQ
jgi:hypothetical protein